MKGYGGSNFGGTISPVAFRGKKPVATYNDLPVTNNEPNDLRAVADTDHLYMWTLDTPSGNLGDWADIGSTVGNLDTIADGSTYGKTLLSELASGKVKQLDDGSNLVTAATIKLVTDNISFVDAKTSTYINGIPSAATGGSNTTLGHTAGDSITSGNKNVCIGDKA